MSEREEKFERMMQAVLDADITTTMNIYAEAMEAKKKEAFANLEGKIKIR